MAGAERNPVLPGLPEVRPKNSSPSSHVFNAAALGNSERSQWVIAEASRSRLVLFWRQAVYASSGRPTESAHPPTAAEKRTPPEVAEAPHLELKLVRRIKAGHMLLATAA
jgi:hypothetical protein